MARKHWRGVSGFCVKEEAVDGDEKIYYKTFVNPVMMSGAVTFAVKREQEKKLHEPEMRILRLMCIIVKLGRIRNERIRDTAKMDVMSNTMQERLKWCGHVIGRAEGHV